MLLGSARISTYETSPTREAAPLFNGVFLGGSECSCQRLEGKRLDLLVTAQHERFARQDYARLRAAGMSAAPGGSSWIST